MTWPSAEYLALSIIIGLIVHIFNDIKKLFINIVKNILSISFIC